MILPTLKLKHIIPNVKRKSKKLTSVVFSGMNVSFFGVNVIVYSPKKYSIHFKTCFLRLKATGICMSLFNSIIYFPLVLTFSRKLRFTRYLRCILQKQSWDKKASSSPRLLQTTVLPEPLINTSLYFP